MSKKQLIQKTNEAFESHFKSQASHHFLSPGRINLIGEHIDYNHGFVLPAAINKYICFAVKAHHLPEIQLLAIDLNDYYSIDLNQPIQPIEKTWVNYILGMVHQMQEKGLKLNGLSIAFSSNIPMGAGLSSSAALECGFGFTLNKIHGSPFSRMEIALMGQKTEHDFVGVKCGIMDQVASILGQKKQFILLDCLSHHVSYAPIDWGENQLILLDSRVKHSHISSGYNDRRNEVTQGFQIIQSFYPEVKSFREISESQLLNIKQNMTDKQFQRCLFVIQEIARVHQAVMAIQESDIQILGACLSETHRGLSSLYEVSCPELDFLVFHALEFKEVLGARMMGGGFGGCMLAIVKKSATKTLIESLKSKFKRKFSIDLVSYPIKISEGTHLYEPQKAIQS
jgi:galactokinase